MQRPDFDLTGQVALVTGAGRGIGSDLARALAACGAHVLAAVRDPDATDVDWTAPGGGRVEPLRLDVTDVAGTRAAVDAAVATYGRIDILVNNAGLGANHDALDVGEADWDQMMAVNLKGLFFTSQAVGRHMVARGYGRIVNLSSQAGLVGIRRHAVYSASKGGVNLVTKVLALEWAPHGVTVNAIAPDLDLHARDGRAPRRSRLPGRGPRADPHRPGRHDRRRRGRRRLPLVPCVGPGDGRDPAGRRGLDGPVDTGTQPEEGETMTTLENRPNTALLVVDAQNGVVEGAYRRDAIVANIGSLVEKARRERVPVVWVQHSDEQLARMSDGWRIVPELTPGDAEPLVEKRYGDAFEDTTLETVLAGLGVGRLVVVGAQTDACIRSTLHGAFARGYDATLVSDAHTTEDQTAWGAPPPEQVIAHTNLYWTYQAAPGRTAGTVETRDVDFGGVS